MPFYCLSKEQPLNIHLRYIKDSLEQKRPDFETQHRDSYYIFLFQSHGEIQLMVDFEDVVLKGAGIYFLLPGQVHKLISSKNSSRWLLATEASNIDRIFEQALEEFHHRLPISISLNSQYQFSNVFQTLNELLKQTTSQQYNNSIISHMISVCAGLYVSTYNATQRETKSSNTRPKDIERNFRILLRKNILLKKSPSDYANLLHISPSYLNECVKKVSGKPVSYWIQQEIILEAKRLLAFTNISIKEMSFQLGYSDHAYFSRQFVKIAGISPSNFRKNYRE